MATGESAYHLALRCPHKFCLLQRSFTSKATLASLLHAPSFYFQVPSHMSRVAVYHPKLEGFPGGTPYSESETSPGACNEEEFMPCFEFSKRQSNTNRTCSAPVTCPVNLPGSDTSSSRDVNIDSRHCNEERSGTLPTPELLDSIEYWCSRHINRGNFYLAARPESTRLMLGTRID